MNFVLVATHRVRTLRHETKGIAVAFAVLRRTTAHQPVRTQVDHYKINRTAFTATRLDAEHLPCASQPRQDVAGHDDVIIPTLCRSWLMKMMVQLVRDATPVNLRSACDISRA
jgi:hypothetical protein